MGVHLDINMKYLERREREMTGKFSVCFLQGVKRILDRSMRADSLTGWKDEIESDELKVGGRGKNRGTFGEEKTLYVIRRKGCRNI